MDNQALKTELKAILTNWLKDYTSQKPCPAIGFGAETYAQVKEQVFDDLVGDFMRDKWGSDWQDNDEAQAFYENIACDLRGDAEYDMQEWIDQYGEFEEKVTVTGMNTETVDDNLFFIIVKYMTGNGEEHEIYLNADMTATGDDEYHQAQVVTSCFTDEDQAKFDNLVEDEIKQKVLGFTDVVDVESLFGCSLADYGVYKYTSSQGKIAVLVRKYYKDIAYEDNSNHFENEDAFKAWSDEMMADYHYGDASIVSRAIEDIEGEN